MDAEMKEIFDLLLGKMDGLQKEVKEVRQEVVATNIKIENDVSQRIVAASSISFAAFS